MVYGKMVPALIVDRRSGVQTTALGVQLVQSSGRGNAAALSHMSMCVDVRNDDMFWSLRGFPFLVFGVGVSETKVCTCCTFQA